MIEIQVGKDHKILLYKSADELPMKLYSKFQKYNLTESGLGSDMGSIGLHFSRLFEFLRFNKSTDALEEAKNLYYNFFTLLEEINIPGLAFCCLVHSIDGEPVKDYSEDSLKQMVQTLSDMGLAQKTAEGWVDDVKKKSSGN
jgi:hypothetical protein